MRKTLQSHFWYYSSLIILLALGFMLVILSANQPQIQSAAVVMTAFFYAFWGIFHHAVHHDISARIVVEYVLIASLGVSLTLLILH